MQVYFIGPGPGDLTLRTIKGLEIIQKADMIIYADSLVNPGIRSLIRKDARIYGSSALTLEEIKRLVVEAVNEGKLVARVHSGDPSIFGAVMEQMAILDEAGVNYEVVPGVSSFSAAAASLKVEYTMPEVAQTIIITRREGRTPVPERENLKALASHGSSMAIFLSVGMIKEVVRELLEGGYPADTPAAVIRRASWPNEQICRALLEKLPEEVEKAGIKDQALILVGKFLDREARRKASGSRLYSKDFSHGRRKAR
ncbi:MAG: precorrin-4 C(11)-methyltransferase [Dehalococcoidia bacterium]|nr:precorrin-4 C(11)-methyltransferase [Dehalococcoidia bacterium]